MYRSHKPAKSLSPELRKTVESVLGRSLEEDELVVVRTPTPHEGSVLEGETAELAEFLEEVDAKEADASNALREEEKPDQRKKPAREWIH